MRALLIVVLQILKVCIQQVAVREKVKIFVTFKIEIIKYSIDTLLMADNLHCTWPMEATGNNYTFQ